MSLRQFEYVFISYNDLRWPDDEQVCAFLAEQVWDLMCLGNMNQKPGIWCMREPAPPPTALLRAILQKGEIEKCYMSHDTGNKVLPMEWVTIAEEVSCLSHHELHIMPFI